MPGNRTEKSAGPDSVRTKVNPRGAPKRLLTAVDHQRSEFLRSCRARLKPEDVGLSQHQRARTGGLRREDVAVLSGVSVSWYTWLEQGRDIRVSDEVLERLSQTLRLTEDERTYLFSLVQQRPPRVHGEKSPSAPPDVVRMLHAVNLPAVAMNLRWDVLAWNSLNAAIYRDYGKLPVGERNLLEILLTQPVRHMNAAQLEATAQRLCARLRYDYSKCADDPKFEALVRRLSSHSNLFSRVWRSPDFTLRAYGLHRFTHARFGALSFEHTSYVPDGHHNIRVVICTPENAAAKRAIALVNAEAQLAGAKKSAK
jgi:transcriptional regulator with XRE-family HTH domain